VFARWKTYDIQNNFLVIDLSEDEDLDDNFKETTGRIES